MKKIVIWVLLLGILSPAFASNQERDLQAVFLGRFAKFIEWPNTSHEKFIITLIDENPFENLLDDLYRDKTIHGKEIEIHYVTNVADIKYSDILFITLDSQKGEKEAIKYAQENSILSISAKRGFAQRGGIIQLNFVMQKSHLVINNYSALESNIKISAPLLAIAKNVIREVQ